MSQTCTECGESLRSGAQFCRFCGTRVSGPTPSTCGRCGHINPPGSRFCRTCGAPVHTAELSAVTARQKGDLRPPSSTLPPGAVSSSDLSAARETDPPIHPQGASRQIHTPRSAAPRRSRRAWKAIAAILALGIVAGGTVTAVFLLKRSGSGSHRTSAERGKPSRATASGRTAGTESVLSNSASTNLHTSGWLKPVNLGSGPLGSVPTAGVDGHGNEYVFWRGTNGALWDKWFVGGQWHGPGPIHAAGTDLASAPTVAVHADGQQDVFWKGTDGDLWELSHRP
jgi:hypothetical protein